MKIFMLIIFTFLSAYSHADKDLTDADYAAMQRLSVDKYSNQISATNAIEEQHKKDTAFTESQSQASQNANMTKSDAWTDASLEFGNCKLPERASEIAGLIKCASSAKGAFDGIRYNVDFSVPNRFSATFSKDSIYRSESSTSFMPGDYWSVDCATDAITDVRACTLVSNKVFSYYTINKKSPSFSILGDAYPFTNRVFRFLNKKPIVSAIKNKDGNDFSSQQSQIIHNNLIQGLDGLTRYTSWPHDTYVDTNFYGAGYKEAFYFAKSVLMLKKSN